MKTLIKKFSQHFKPSELPSIILFASPRGGSTWVTELIASQPGFWPISEPLNVRSQWVRKQLRVNTFADLYGDAATPKIYKYYRKIFDGKLPDLKLRPGLPFYRPLTRRIVVKENQAGLDRLSWFEDTFGVRIVHLLRHPIPVALSREVFPLLEGFSECDLRKQFSTVELELADRIIRKGSHVQKGVLAWCLHHVPALRNPRDSWLTLTYEDTVLNPRDVIQQLAEKLLLPDAAAMAHQIKEPSQTSPRKEEA